MFPHNMKISNVIRKFYLNCSSSQLVGMNFSQTFLIVLFVLQCGYASVNISMPINGEAEIKWSSSKTLSQFMCPADLNLLDPSKFCENGTTPVETVIDIHKTELLEHNEKFQIDNDSFRSHRFCVKSIQETQLSLILCKILAPMPLLKVKETESHSHYKTGNMRPDLRLRKCCKPWQRVLMTKPAEHMGMVAYECVPKVSTPNDTIWNPAILLDMKTDFVDHKDLQNLSADVSYKIGFPNCTNFKELDHHQDIWFKILESGEVVIGLKFWFKPVWLPLGSDNQSYCLDELDPASKGEEDTKGKTSHEIFHRNQVLLYCGIERFDSYLFHRKLFGTLCVAASLCFVALLAIYLSIWDRQNLAGWTQFNIFVAVFFVFGMEGVRTLVDYNAINVQATTSCLVVAAIAQYFFFALNTTWCVMNFDLFWTFWKLESSVKGTKGHGKRILAYLFFSWGLPLIMILSFFLKFMEAFAHRRCSSPIREFGFQTQGVMFLCNVVFFGFTGVLIWKHRRGVTNSRRNSRSERHTWRSVILFAKLLVVMGVSSLSIPLDYFFGSEDPLNNFEVLFRMIHFIPVIAIVFIFGFNEKNMGLIKQKYPNFGQIMGIQLFNMKPSTTDTNPSQSNGGQNNQIQNVTEIR